MDSDFCPSPSPIKAQGKAAKQPLGEATNAGKAKGRAIEETYKKLSQLEHILLRPDARREQQAGGSRAPR